MQKGVNILEVEHVIPILYIKWHENFHEKTNIVDLNLIQHIIHSGNGYSVNGINVLIGL